ncbi:distal tail protein Dit [Salinicoccus sp. HZC-1]|uniref:distal tail protein Dit n=1 Tax=Salinicoccus sp. HZC-1 TaxID=3385497 RepID=UPI00398AB05B
MRTLKVIGRDFTEYEVKNTNTPGRDGVLNQGKFLKPRPLKIRMKIKSDSHLNLIKLMESINKHFDSRIPQVISFSDERMSYYGAFVSKGETSGYKKSEIIDFDFICHDSYKYTEERIINYTNTAILSVDTKYPVKPTIDIVFSPTTTEISIRNTTTDKTINIDGSVYGPVTIDVYENELLRGTEDMKSDMYLSSDWEDFTINDGDQIVVTPTPESMIIKYRGVYL